MEIFLSRYFSASVSRDWS